MSTMGKLNQKFGTVGRWVQFKWSQKSAIMTSPNG